MGRNFGAAVVVLGLAAASGGNALAAESDRGGGRWYAGFAVPVMFIDETESITTGNQALDPGAPMQRQPYRSESTSSYETGFKVAGMLGYEFGGGLRVEGELFFARAGVDRVSYRSVTTPRGALPVTVDIPVSGKADQLGAIASVWYDFRTGSDWIPFIGGGIGFIRVDQSDLEYNSGSLANAIATAGARLQNPNAPAVTLPPGTVPEISTADTTFAFHVGAGVGYRLTGDTILQVGYRLQRADKLGFDGANRFGTVEVGTAFRAHLVELGIRHRF